MKNGLRLLSFILGSVCYIVFSIYNKQVLDYSDCFWVGVFTCVVYCQFIEEENESTTKN